MINKTSNRDLELLFAKLGIKKDDILMIHADLRIFGFLENGGGDLVSILVKLVGHNGCLVTPSFTFSFPNVFDINKSVSTTGALSKLFGAYRGVLRVPDGMTSYYLIGAASKKFISKWRHSSYGKNSIPDQLVKKNAKIVQLGTDILSLIHYLEEKVSVPYREVTRFSGVIKDGQRETSSYTDLYIRNKPVKKLIPDPIRSNYYKKYSDQILFNDKVCRIFDAAKFVNYGIPILQENRRILIEG